MVVCVSKAGEAGSEHKKLWMFDLVNLIYGLECIWK